MPRKKPLSKPTIRFPVLQSLHIEKYGLYPGPATAPIGLSANFSPGLTLVLGTNGLGKTTLVWILYRALSGPFDIPGFDDRGELGGKNLEARPLPSAQRRMFAQRVMDNAADATVRLTFALGKHIIAIARKLSNLELMSFSVDGEELSIVERESYQVTIAELAGVWSFGDWLLLLRYITFYFEDRRELVWDASAQRQVLRLMFLPAPLAREWYESERNILELDSRARNLGAALYREETVLANDVALGETALDVREELKSLTALQDVDTKRREELDEKMFALDRGRKDARLAQLRFEQDRESIFRELEHAKLVALAERFPSVSDTSRYIFAQLLSESECLACGSEVPEVARTFETRLSQFKCVVCGTQLARKASKISLSDERIARTVRGLEVADAKLTTAKTEVERAGLEYETARRQLYELDAAASQRRERIDALVRRLPKEQAALIERRNELAQLRSRFETLREELQDKRAKFALFVDSVKDSFAAHGPKIKEIFEKYAREFLIEQCKLTWQPQKVKIGQSGITIEITAFELDMASASFRSAVRRTGPEQVSESQREFIDLAFRMAMMAVADPDSGGTLVIDAPESSLDAVFVRRAADVLGKFAKADSDNRLIVTSNLTDGELVPQLLAHFKNAAREGRLVDLFEIAEPTAAVRRLKDEYVAIRTKILKPAPKARKGN